MAFFVQDFEEDQPKDSEKWSWVKNAWSQGRSEERVNNSVDLLSRVLVTFSAGQISALVTVTHFCCNLLLQMLECYWTCSHAHLACFLFETNQYFIGSARIAGLCFEIGVKKIMLWSHHAEIWCSHITIFYVIAFHFSLTFPEQKRLLVTRFRCNPNVVTKHCHFTKGRISYF